VLPLSYVAATLKLVKHYKPSTSMYTVETLRYHVLYLTLVIDSTISVYVQCWNIRYRILYLTFGIDSTSSVYVHCWNIKVSYPLFYLSNWIDHPRQYPPVCVHFWNTKISYMYLLSYLRNWFGHLRQCPPASSCLPAHGLTKLHLASSLRFCNNTITNMIIYKILMK